VVVKLVLKQQYVIEEHDLFSRLQLLHVDALQRFCRLME
jgi:hypothetical protein